MIRVRVFHDTPDCSPSVDNAKYSLCSKKLDETTAELKRTGLALEMEKEKTDMLLYQMLPRKVANQLREGTKADAGTQHSWRAHFIHSL